MNNTRLFLICFLICLQANFAQTIITDNDDEVIPIRRNNKSEKADLTDKTTEISRGLEIVNYHINAIGGQEKLNKINRYKANFISSIESAGDNSSIEMILNITYYSSEKQLIEVEMDGNSIGKQFVDRGKIYTLIADGDWSKDTKEIEYKYSKSKSIFLDYDFILSNHNINYIGVEEKNGVTCYKIEVPTYREYTITENGTKSKLTINVINHYRIDSNLLYASELISYQNNQFNAKDKGDLFYSVTTIYTDYKNIDGVLFPHTTNYIMETGGNITKMKNTLQNVVINPVLEELGIH